VIGFGAPHLEGTAATHGSALGPDEVAATRVNLGWEFPPFVVPDDILSAWDATERGAALEREWRAKLDAYREAHPELAAEYLRRVDGRLPDGFDEDCRAMIAEIAAEAKDMATRKASERALEGLAPLLPELVGGSADLTGSNNTRHSHSRNVTGADASGNYVHFGVREFGMTAVLSGLSLHGGFIPYGGTFLVFSDYARNAIRMASLMRARAVYVHTHDSIGLGEDGPTHQPIEHLASLRAIPNLHVWRPCDAVETAAAWCAAIARADGPCVLVLSRQGLPHVERSGDQIELIGRGGYILANGDGPPEMVLIATGSEVSLALGAAAELEASGMATRVVSMPCVDVFAEQDEDYRAHVLPAGTKRLVIEAGVSDGWWRYLGGRGDVVSMHGFGQSAPAKDLFAHFGFTVDNVVATARRIA
jgi:transketolase